MTIVYHGTQTRHLPGIFSSNKLVGFWSTGINTAFDFSVVLTPEDDQLFPPDKTSIIIVADIDIENESELHGDPEWLVPIKGYLESSRILYGMKYDGPIVEHNIVNTHSWNDWKDIKHWKKKSIAQMKQYSRISKSIVDGMLFIEPDPIALQFKTLLHNNHSPYQFMGNHFVLEDIFPIHDLTERNQHDQDNGIDTIIIFKKSRKSNDLTAYQYCSINRTYDGIDIKMPFIDLLKLDRRTRTNKIYQMEIIGQ